MMNSRQALRRNVRWLTAALLLLASAMLEAADVERTGGPYVPTPQTVVDAMLDLAKVGPNDFVIDLGSGDGRIVLTATERYKARALGFDIDPELVEQSNAEARKRGIAERATFEQQDVLKADIDRATVLTLYLLPGMMQTLQAKLIKELRPGTRIVSHDFTFGDWKPDREVTVDVAEKYGTPGQWKSTLFYWVVPAQVQGSWNIEIPALASAPISLGLQQQYQWLTGVATIAGKPVQVSDAKVEADQVRFRLALPTGVYEFRGAFDAGHLMGTAVQAGRSVPWTGVKVSPATSPQAQLRAP